MALEAKFIQRDRPPEVIVAGHVCLDIIPDWGEATSELQTALTPGALLKIGPATLSPGGAVSNTGMALHRLGVATRLMGKVGNDAFGRMILEIFRSIDPALSDSMIISPGEQTSYTVVLSPPNTDRVFLHHSGANDRFDSTDMDTAKLSGARLLHFGYPPVMRRLSSDGGLELSRIFSIAKSSGLATCMDMAQIDRQAEAARVDWAKLLARVLPHVDIFFPSLDEILFMLGESAVASEAATPATLARIADRLIDMGSAIVVLKLGEDGLYFRATADVARLQSIGGKLLADPHEWAGRRMAEPSFAVDVVGTTGAGDCAIAGFLAGLLLGLGPQECLTASAATGACCVEKPDATSGVPNWNALQERISAGWKRRAAHCAIAKPEVTSKS